VRLALLLAFLVACSRRAPALPEACADIIHNPVRALVPGYPDARLRPGGSSAAHVLELDGVTALDVRRRYRRCLGETPSLTPAGARFPLPRQLEDPPQAVRWLIVHEGGPPAVVTVGCRGCPD
jgi:hypothetical protein